MRSVVRSLAAAASLLLAPAIGSAQAPKPAEAPKPAAPAAKPATPAAKPSTDDTLYALGVAMSRNLKQLNLTPAEVEAVKRGLTDALTAKPKVNLADYDAKIQAFANERLAAAAKKNREEGKAYLAKAAAEKGAQKTASGAIYRSTKEGTGATPKPSQHVKLGFEGRLVDGTVFETTSKDKQLELPVTALFPCLAEGVQKMKVGGKAHLVCPPESAFGDQGRPPTIAGGATIVIDIDLVAVSDAPTMQMPEGHGGMGMPPGHGGGAEPAPVKK
jgi:FKBP-type peptidyl-prolyl cis-trans isomerase FkpA